jgi:hypothetical protein
MVDAGGPGSGFLNDTILECTTFNPAKLIAVAASIGYFYRLGTDAIAPLQRSLLSLLSSWTMTGLVQRLTNKHQFKLNLHINLYIPFRKSPHGAVYAHQVSQVGRHYFQHSLPTTIYYFVSIRWGNMRLLCRCGAVLLLPFVLSDAPVRFFYFRITSPGVHIQLYSKSIYDGLTHLGAPRLPPEARPRTIPKQPYSSHGVI